MVFAAGPKMAVNRTKMGTSIGKAMLNQHPAVKEIERYLEMYFDFRAPLKIQIKAAHRPRYGKCLKRSRLGCQYCVI